MKNFKEFVENYGNITEESFIDTYLKDKEVFGEETKGLYEDVLSEIIGEDVDLQDFDDAIEEASFTKLPNFSNKAMDKLDWDRKVAERELNDKDLRDLNNLDTGVRHSGNLENITLKEKLPKGFDNNILNKDNQKIANGLMTDPNNFYKSAGLPSNAGDEALKFSKAVEGKNPSNFDYKLNPTTFTTPGATGGEEKRFADSQSLFGKLKVLLAGLVSKIKNALSGSKDGSVKSYLSKGFNYLVDPANTKKILGVTGGVIALGLIINALRKRHELNKYKNLQAVYNSQKRAVNECYEGNFDSTIGKAIIESYENDNVMRILEDAYGVDYSVINENFSNENENIEEEDDNSDDDIEEDSTEEDKKSKYFGY
jgi:hypothetical protein